MKVSFNLISVIIAAVLFLSFNQPVLAKGGFIELDGDFNTDMPAEDDYSNKITNPWWPLPEGNVFVYVAEEDDECVASVVVVLDGSRVVDGVPVRTVLDVEFIDEDGACDGATDDEPDFLEVTQDWYAQDKGGNIWYFGEHSVALDAEMDECDNWVDNDDVFGLTGCLDGSWEAGLDIDGVGSIAEEGIIMLTMPRKGQFYFQEFYEDVATDMGKILNFKPVESVFYETELDDCVKIKEWVPLSPGNIEHKYFCYGFGLIQVEGNAGGKTEWTDLVDVYSLP